MKKFGVLAAILLVATVVLTSVGCANKSSGPGVVSSWKGEVFPLDETTKANFELAGVKVNKNSAEAIFYNDNTFKVSMELDVTVPDGLKIAGLASTKLTIIGSYTGDAAAAAATLNLTINNVEMTPSDSSPFEKGQKSTAVIANNQIVIADLVTLEKQ